MKAQGNERGDRFRGNKEQLATLEQELAKFQSNLGQLQPLTKRRESYQATIARSEERLSTMSTEIAEWRGGVMASRLADLETALADDSEALGLREVIETNKTVVESRRLLADQQRQIEGQIARGQARLEQIGAELSEWERQGRATLEETVRRLAENDYAAEDRAAMAELVSRLKIVGYDQEAHAAAARSREEFSGAPEEKQQLLQAEAAVKPLTDTLADFDRQRENLEARTTSVKAQQAEASKRLQELEAGLGSLQEAEAELRRLREVVVEANRVVGGARQRVEVLDVQRANQARITSEKTHLAHRMGLLRQLEEACGRIGVQAMLIEAALPEIEAYANELLYRLTNGEMRVAFRAQRPRKSGRDNPIETLDIEILDSDGERPYENYSGGEKFRINFAIRLALSQVLARRAGAQLRMLVVDEGFGSQDPEGRQRLVEAINTVRNEFECILVITHVEDLRDKFPNRIEVEKTPEGSQLSVVAV
jgi:exonuclease SbcC